MKTNREILAKVEAQGLPHTYGGTGVPCWLVGGYWYTADVVTGEATKQAEGFSRTGELEWKIPLSEALGTLIQEEEKKGTMNTKRMGSLEIEIKAWGYGLTEGNELVYFNGTSSGGLSPEALVPTIQLNREQAAAVHDELTAVSCDRFAAWPTVERYAAELAD